MVVHEEFIQAAALLCERGRASMLWHLLDGRALTATELAVRADLSPQSASGHLKLLVEAGILKVDKQGRHRYYSYARPEVADIVESLASLGQPDVVKAHYRNPAPDGLRYARTCYDHLAGRLAVNITQSLLDRNVIAYEESEFTITDEGRGWLSSVGIDIRALQSRKRRCLARPCLDWSERQHHIGGALGAALLDHFLNQKWIRRMPGARTVVVTNQGRAALSELLGIG